MFLVNSRLGLFSASALAEPLLPKLRGHFAEFLDNASPVGLRILSSPACVGFRYGRACRHSGFSRRRGPGGFATALRSPSGFAFSGGFFLPGTALPLAGYFRSPAPLPFRVPAVLGMRGAGISARSPSATAFALALGPDLPRAD